MDRTDAVLLGAATGCTDLSVSGSLAGVHPWNIASVAIFGQATVVRGDVILENAEAVASIRDGLGQRTSDRRLQLGDSDCAFLAARLA
jgi:hypothetical protein